MAVGGNVRWRDVDQATAWRPDGLSTVLGYERLYAGGKRRVFFDSTVCSYRLGVEEHPNQAFRIQGAESFGEDACSLSPSPQDTVVLSEYVEIFPKTIK